MWEIKKEKGIPLYRSIADLIMQKIKDGQLLPGERLPSERKLAEELKINRSTVVHALDELVSIGVIVRKRGSGTLVNDGKWGIFTGTQVDWRQYLSFDNFDNSTNELEKIKKKLQTKSSNLIDAYTGELPFDLVPSIDLPSISWKEFLKEEEYQDDLGYRPLRKKIAWKIQKEQELPLTSEQLLLTSGAQQALYLITQVLLKPGDAVAIEDPSFFYGLPLFQAAGIRLYGIEMDAEGMIVEKLEQVIMRKKIKMIFVNPTFQNPTGRVMSLARRKALVKICQHYQLPIVEDDVFGELSFPATPKIPTIKKLDPENVVYIGSLSKELGSTTKIGWVSAPAKVLDQLAKARKEMDFSLSIFPQVLALNALESQAYPQKIINLREELDIRCQALMSEIDRKLGKSWNYVRPQGGYYLWLENQDQNLDSKKLRQLTDQNLLVLTAGMVGSKSVAIRLNFARIPAEQAQVVVEVIRRLE
ncbi:PLP-dependent aminotransferase family protein [Vagococcus entomophilus]|uniref:GntR family transcriptional regulator n=1 Tax=Vagococcus entomophilus TaxID=1160095 RepID=A0A430AEU7_9ENTE|nr:PLP-dependent aminotransferase family protein [Vagococcus entomophilus]RSU05951.1 GntR family transcriptional regulator [Vagococcus entomophilus]